MNHNRISATNEPVTLFSTLRVVLVLVLVVGAILLASGGSTAVG